MTSGCGRTSPSDWLDVVERRAVDAPFPRDVCLPAPLSIYAEKAKNVIISSVVINELTFPDDFVIHCLYFEVKNKDLSNLLIRSHLSALI